ncbi:hypothetical protein SAY86_014637 [Trapa natans]|uniref:Uncharacterized protein n=1 Tax=Trapa natans TaxID=22666 RepID=A0AAN7KGV5_TRANT|nr:hypothetical protein SAY86_014637 [Trapa natans]
MSNKSMVSSAVSSELLRKQPSRLRQRAPASLRIASPVLHWNAAIPLLSPVASSSTRTEQIYHPTAARPREIMLRQPESKSTVFKTWHHPAASFCSDPAPMVFSFSPV